MTEPRHKRLERIRKEVEGRRASGWLADFPLEDIEFLLYALEERDMQLAAQHNAVDEAARNWRKIGYDAGYNDGYGDCAEALGSESLDD